MDLSQLLKSDYRKLYKFKKSFGSPLSTARTTQNDRRRMTRDAEMFSRRRMNEKEASPCVTPNLPGRTKLDAARAKRYEQLISWKRERETKREQEKQKSKPMFKVTHVPMTIGLPNLENVNKVIKGKLFSTATIASKHNESYKFAPANHKFKAPSNIKPLINIEQSKKLTTKPPVNFNSCQRVTRSQKAVLPNLELPSRGRRKLNLNVIGNEVKISKSAKQPVAASTFGKKSVINLDNKLENTLKLYSKSYKNSPDKIIYTEDGNNTNGGQTKCKSLVRRKRSAGKVVERMKKNKGRC